MMVIINALLILVACWTVRIWWLRRNRPPGPFPLPIIGNLLHLNAITPYKSLAQLADKYGPVYGMQLGGVYTVVVSDANLIREALRSELFTGRAPLYITHGIMGGFGLICSEGELWKDQRRLTIGWLKRLGMVKFGETRLSLEKRISNGVNQCIEMLSERQAKPQDPLTALHHTLGNIMNDLVFGVKFDESDETWQYLQHLQEEGVRHIGVSGVVNFLPWLRHLPSNSQIIQFLLSGKQKTHNIYDTIIEKVERQLSDHDATQDSNIIEMFLRVKHSRQSTGEAGEEHCSAQQLRHLLADLFGAGVDTTLTTIRWFLLYVSRDEMVQRCLEMELREQLNGEEFSFEHYSKLPYLRATIAETQRIRSVVPIGIPHGATHDTSLCGYHIPAGTMFVPLQWAVHMNPCAWPEPERFRPQRFLNEVGEFTVPTNFIPFQTGKRMCLGEELAKMLLFAYCGSIVAHFRWSCRPSSVGTVSMQGDCGITLTPPRCEMVFEKKE